MAKVQYGALITEIKGSIGGSVFQGGNVGNVLRNKGYTPGISSLQRQAATSALSTQASAWKSLTDVQRGQWAAIVASWPFTDKFGNAYQGSAFQVFVAYNSVLISLQQPTVLVPGAPVVPTDPGVVVVDFDSSPTFNITWDNAGGANDCFSAFISPPISAGRNLNHLRLIKGYGDGINATSGVDVSNGWVAKYGNPLTGTRVGVKYAFFDKRFPRPYFGATVATVIHA